jgi:hypothetical protein
VRLEEFPDIARGEIAVGDEVRVVHARIAVRHDLRIGWAAVDLRPWTWCPKRRRGRCRASRRSKLSKATDIHWEQYQMKKQHWHQIATVAVDDESQIARNCHVAQVVHRAHAERHENEARGKIADCVCPSHIACLQDACLQDPRRRTDRPLMLILQTEVEVDSSTRELGACRNGNARSVSTFCNVESGSHVSLLCSSSGLWEPLVRWRPL